MFERDSSAYSAILRRQKKVTLFLLPILAVSASVSADDEPRGLARLFRFGSSRHSSKPAPKPEKHNHDRDFEDDDDLEEGARKPLERSYRVSEGRPVDPEMPFQPAITSPGFGESNSSRISARPKYAGAVTDADPVLTRVGVARADSGNSFALFIQIYADGTVIDTEGVHRLPVSQIKSILSVIRGHDFSRVRGHCGQPSADFIENVQMIVYDRAMGKLRANAFSYTGDPKGCDASVAHLHKAVDELIMSMASARSGGIAETTSPGIAGGSVETLGGSSTNEQPAFGESTNAGELSRSIVTTPPAAVTTPAPSITPAPTGGGAVVPRLPAASAPSPFTSNLPSALPELTPPQ